MPKSKVIARDRVLSMGLDVDKEKSQVCVLDVDTGQLIFDGTISHDPEAWERFLARVPGCGVWACYEAGGNGYGLCRWLLAHGVDCNIIAPSQVPKPPQARQQKTDERDALLLARLYWTPPRSWVRVPTEQEEADRQLIRTRDQVMNDRVRVMSRIKSMLLAYGLKHGDGVRLDWSKAFRHWLATCACLPPVRTALDVLLCEALDDQLAVLKRAIRTMNDGDVHRDRVKRLRQIPGVGPLTANAFVTELFRPEDFASGKQVAAHLGLTPCEWSSGGSVRHGHITHWGPPHLRKLLVEAAWIWVFRDPLAARRYARIRAGKARKIAIVAMARKLAIIMWAMLVKQQDYCHA